MISVLVLYLTFGVFSNALIYPTNQNTHSGGFAVRSNQQNDVMTSQCDQLYSKTSEDLIEKYKCKTGEMIKYEYAFSQCVSHCCFLKDFKNSLENEINGNNECPKTKILETIVDTDFVMINLDCESIGCKCFQKYIDAFESNQKRVYNKNCPNGRCDNKTLCCTILEANNGFRDEMKNANECESKVREEIIKRVDTKIYSLTNHWCPDCSFKAEKSNEVEAHKLCLNKFKDKALEIKTKIKMKCGDVCSDSLKCCILYETYKEIESQYKSKSIENCGQKHMDLLRTHWSEINGLLLKHCSHCSSNVESSVDSINRWYHSIGLVSIVLTVIHKIFKF